MFAWGFAIFFTVILWAVLGGRRGSRKRAEWLAAKLGKKKQDGDV